MPQNLRQFLEARLLQLPAVTGQPGGLTPDVLAAAVRRFQEMMPTLAEAAQAFFQPLLPQLATPAFVLTSEAIR